MNIFKMLFGKKVDAPTQIKNEQVKCDLVQPKQVEKQKSIAERLHDSTWVESHIEDVIMEAYKKYEPELYGRLDFHIGSDEYDNSIEIYFDISLPYPYEPCKEIRKAIYDLGFSIVYWNFNKDTMDVMCDRFIGTGPEMVKNSIDEIRGWEPRHNKHAHWIPNKYGYVDDRFKKKKWEKKYNYRESNCSVKA